SVVLTSSRSPHPCRSQKEGRPPGGWPPPELREANSTLLRGERRVPQSLEHRTDGIRERAARAAREAETDWVVARLGHHERAGVAGVDEVPGRHDLTR